MIHGIHVIMPSKIYNLKLSEMDALMMGTSMLGAQIHGESFSDTFRLFCGDVSERTHDITLNNKHEIQIRENEIWHIIRALYYMRFKHKNPTKWYLRNLDKLIRRIIKLEMDDLEFRDVRIC